MTIAGYDTKPCRSPRCGRLLVWQQLVKKDGTLGKMAPYDYPPEPCPDCHGGLSECGKCHGTGFVWISHFATCPDAGRFKRK